MTRKLVIVLMLCVLCFAFSKGYSEAAASAWTGRWVNTDNQDTVLDITSNGDGTLHLAAHFAPDLSFAFDFPPVDYELLYFDTLEDPFPADMRIDGKTGMLEFSLYEPDANFGRLSEDASLRTRISQYAGTYYFTTDNPPDLKRFGWIPYDEPEALTDEEARRLFSRLSDTPLMAASGAGAWEGRLRIHADGSFIGEYHDSEDDMVYRVSFSGSFSPHVEEHGNTYWLWVEEMSTRQAPGTRAVDEYGVPVTYTDPPFGDGNYMVLTMPGAPAGDIPEMVQGEIGGTYDEWEDYSHFITLTRLEDGWGFFADPRDPIDYDPEPFPAATPAAAPERMPMEGRVLIDDELWTLVLLGKEQKYSPGYILRMRNNSGRDLSVAVYAQVRFRDTLSADFRGRDDLSVYEPLICKLPAGADFTRDLVFSMMDLAIRTADDLYMADIWFSIWDGNGGTLRDYENVLLDWDPAVTAEGLFTPLCPIAPQELSGDPSLVSVRALGTYQFVTGRAGILCRVTNNSRMQMKIGGYNVDFRGNFTFVPEVNGLRCSNVLGEMRKSDGALKRGWLEPGESAYMFFSFAVDGTEVTAISSASILLELLTPSQEKAKSVSLGRYICNLSFTPVAAPTATPTPTPASADAPKNLPKNVVRLPDGSLRYDDGLIAFEAPGDALIRGNNATYTGKGDIFPANTTLSGFRVMIPSNENLSGFYGLYWPETQKTYFDAVIAGIVQIPPEVGATEFVWAAYERAEYAGYATVAGRTAKYRHLIAGPGRSLINDLKKQTEMMIPLTGNRILLIGYYEYPDAGRTAAVEMFLNTLKIRDSLYAEPPTGTVQTASPAPTPVPTASPTLTAAPAPTAAPDLAAWMGYWMTHDDTMAEMIITDNGNGTLHAKALFLPAGDHEATLTPQGDGSLRFEDQYGSLIGSMIRGADGGLHLTFTGGTTMEDEEATEYQGYFGQGFTYYPTAYADMWYQTPGDAAATEDDWLGRWTAMARGDSMLQISRENSRLTVDVTLGRYRFSGPADMGSDTIMSVYADDFCCMLLLNKKLNRIAMLEADTGIEEVFDITGNPYYGVLVFQKASDYSVPAMPEQIDALSHVELPPTLTMPVSEQAPQTGALLPVPGQAGCFQVPVRYVDASSYIVGKDPGAYVPERMTDGDEQTAWQFSTKKSKLKSTYAYFSFAEPVRIDELWIKNGYWKFTDGHDQYTRNSRVKELEVTFLYEGAGNYTDKITVKLKDDKKREDWQRISLGAHERVVGVRFRVMSAYRGTKYSTDVCISEVLFVQK